MTDPCLIIKTGNSMNISSIIFTLFLSLVCIQITSGHSSNLVSFEVKGPSPGVGIPIDITGTVIDEEGQPLIGVNVVVRDADLGTSTDVDGHYELTDIAGDAVLIFSYIGYQTLEVPVEGRSVVDVTLVSDAALLDEVVVVGYGTQRRRDVTGSISSLNSESFNKGVVSNPGQLLQGKVAGVNVTNISGEPGSEQNVIIRGIGSLRSGTTPLYVVDGFALDNSGTGVVTNPLNFINPRDIESIDVLKDASAAAIYGARAANGVIVITTKKGLSGRTRIDVNVSSGISQLAKKVDVFSADEFRRQVTGIGATLDDGGADTDW